MFIIIYVNVKAPLHRYKYINIIVLTFKLGQIYLKAFN